MKRKLLALLFSLFSLPIFAATGTTATIILTWQASTTPNVTYQVFRETSPGICTATTSGAGPNCLLLTNPSISVLTYTDTLTITNTQPPIYYVVRAMNANGVSGYSNEVKVTFTSTGPPQMPAALTCTGTDNVMTVQCQ